MRFIWIKIALYKRSLNSPDSNCEVLDVMWFAIHTKLPKFLDILDYSRFITYFVNFVFPKIQVSASDDFHFSWDFLLLWSLNLGEKFTKKYQNKNRLYY